MPRRINRLRLACIKFLALVLFRNLNGKMDRPLAGLHEETTKGIPLKIWCKSLLSPNVEDELLEII